MYTNTHTHTIAVLYEYYADRIWSTSDSGEKMRYAENKLINTSQMCAFQHQRCARA